MSWSKSATDANVYQRPLGPSEMGMTRAITASRATPRENIKINAIAHFTASRHAALEVTQAFREAWKALRLLKTPDVATTFDDGNKYYKVAASTEELELWLEHTFKVAQLGSSVQVALEAMQAKVELAPVCEIVPQQTSDGSFKGAIILYVSHWRTEAGGCFMMINQLFEYVVDLLHANSKTRDALSTHVPGSEVQLLTPAIEEMLMPNQQSSPVAKERVGKRFDEYLAQLPCVEFPMQGSPSDPAADFRIIQRTYTPASTADFVSACRANGISVTAAAHAAYVHTLWAAIDSDSSKRPWTCIMPAEIRKRLPQGSPYRDQGGWSATQMLLLSVPAGQDFTSTAKSFKSQYAVAGEDTWLREDMRETTDQLGESFAKMPADQPVSIPWFTSLGLLDSMIVAEHGDLRIDHLTGWADSTGPGVVLRMWTFRERLNIHFAWNSAFHSNEHIRDTMDSIDAILAMELGAKLVIEGVTGVDGL